mgnify:CR=1 FL=1
MFNLVEANSHLKPIRNNDHFVAMVLWTFKGCIWDIQGHLVYTVGVHLNVMVLVLLPRIDIFICISVWTVLVVIILLYHAVHRQVVHHFCHVLIIIRILFIWSWRSFWQQSESVVIVIYSSLRSVIVICSSLRSVIIILSTWGFS